MPMGIEALPSTSRLKNPELGAGSLLDIGVYSLTWGLIALDAEPGEAAGKVKVVGVQSVFDDLDIASSMLPLGSNGEQGILSCSMSSKTEEEFCRIEGTEGTVVVKGAVTSQPSSFTVFRNGEKERYFEFQESRMGYFWEADAVAGDS